MKILKLHQALFCLATECPKAPDVPVLPQSGTMKTPGQTRGIHHSTKAHLDNPFTTAPYRCATPAYTVPPRDMRKEVTLSPVADAPIQTPRSLENPFTTRRVLGPPSRTTVEPNHRSLAEMPGFTGASRPAPSDSPSSPGKPDEDGRCAHSALP